MKTITITTDFGDQLAAAQLRAVLADLRFNGNIIENHSVSPFSIIEGAFAIKLLAKFSPKDSIHVGIIDPGVGSKRRGIIVKTKKTFFIGPDNGLFHESLKNEYIEATWQLQESKIEGEISNTFHGRDIFIKAAAYLCRDKKPENFGCIEINPKTLTKLSFTKGQVLHIDHYGNIKIYWPYHIQIGRKLSIRNQQKYIDIPIVKTFSDVAAGKPLALLGSSGTLELAINLGRADRFWNAKIGDTLL